MAVNKLQCKLLNKVSFNSPKFLKMLVKKKNLWVRIYKLIETIFLCFKFKTS